MEHKILLATPHKKEITEEEKKDDEEKKDESQEDKKESKKSKADDKKSKMAGSKKSIKKTITKDDIFSVNEKFRSPMKRITINQI